MKDHLKQKITRIEVDELSGPETGELIHVVRETGADSSINEDDFFFRKLAYEMTGQVRDLATLIIDFKNGLQSKIQPELVDIAMKYIPQAADQLEAVVEMTEIAAQKIMDNLEALQEAVETTKKAVSSLRTGRVTVPSEGEESAAVVINQETIETLSPFVDYIETCLRECKSLITDSFTQMSFQDLTGQKIRSIVGLVAQMEARIRNMVVSFGIKLAELEKNRDISEEELETAAAKKVSRKAKAQAEGEGLGQNDIDELLADI